MYFILEKYFRKKSKLSSYYLRVRYYLIPSGAPCKKTTIFKKLSDVNLLPYKNMIVSIVTKLRQIFIWWMHSNAQMYLATSHHIIRFLIIQLFWLTIYTTAKFFGEPNKYVGSILACVLWSMRNELNLKCVCHCQYKLFVNFLMIDFFIVVSCFKVYARYRSKKIGPTTTHKLKTQKGN